MKKTNKKFIAIFIAIALVMSFIPAKVFANDAYTLTFTLANNQNTQHSVSIDAGIRLVVDGQFVEPRLASNPSQTVTCSIEPSGDNYVMTITNGEEVVLNFNSANSFELFAQGQSINPGTRFSATESIAIQDYVGGQQGGGQQGGGQQGGDNSQNRTYNVNFGNATWTVGEVQVTATMEGKTINNSQDIVLNDNDIITLTNFNPETMEVRVTESKVSNPFSTTLTVDANSTTKIANRTNNGGIPDNLVFSVEPKSQQGNHPEGDPHFFDGNAYFVWINSANKICYHKFTNLMGRPEQEEQGYEINYVNVSDLTDQSGNNSTYVWGQENANWVLAKDMENQDGSVRTDLTKEMLFGDPNLFDDRGIQLDPCGAENGANSINTNANRNFRATIYRENYNAIKFSSNQNDYTYFPCFWDQTFFSSTVDVSGTTAENPAEYDTYLLESTIRFTEGQFSDHITAVEALNVNPEAVDISIVDGICSIRFNSNYYDNVVFKITAGGQDYFVKINRLVLDIKDNFGPDTEEDYLIARIFYSTENSYDDYEVIATVIYNDGTTDVKVLSPSELRYYDSDDRNRSITGDNYKLNGGKGLYESQCYVAVDRLKLVGAYFTIVTKGALEGDTYNGTFSGSGEGTYYDARTRDIVL